MSQQNTNEVHIYVENPDEKDAVRELIGRGIKENNKSTCYPEPRIYSLRYKWGWVISPNSPSLHCKPMVNLKELQEIVLLISLGIPAEEAISTITKQGYGS